MPVDRRGRALGGLAAVPLIAFQAVLTAARADRLPEPAGPREGRAGAGPPLGLLIVGDSSALGVGVPTQGAALAGRLSLRLSRDRALAWKLDAVSGATAGTTLARLSRRPPGGWDAVLIALGVNDVKNGVPLWRWRRNYAALVELLARRTGASVVVASGVPPIGAFPLLPSPLRDVLGRRADAFDRALRGLASELPAMVHLPFDLPLRPEMMASDGFHPGPAIYDAWAERADAAIRARGL